MMMRTKCSFALLVAAMPFSSVVDAFVSPRLVVRSCEVNKSTLSATTVEGCSSTTTPTATPSSLSYMDRVARGLLEYRCSVSKASPMMKMEMYDYPIASTRPARKPHRVAATPLSEATSRALLATRLEMEQHARTRKTNPLASTRPTRKPHPVAATPLSEATSRALLATRLTMEMAERASRAARAAALEASRTKECRQRNLLTTRVHMDTKVTALKTIVASLEASRTRELRQRSLLATRIAMDVKAAALQAQAAATLELSRARERRQRAILATRIDMDAKAAALEKSRTREARQRGILADRLGAQAAAYADALVQRQIQAALWAARQQPKAPDVEQQLQSKYAAIDCVGERAFHILSDLGMLQDEGNMAMAN